MKEKPKIGMGDVAHAVVRGGLGVLPYVGAPAAELFSLIIEPPLTKRRDDWIESIAQRLKSLEDTREGFDVSALSQDEVFLSTVLQATQSALRTHQEEKLEALLNAVLNAALGQAPDTDLQHMFVRIVDEITPTHLLVLFRYKELDLAKSKEGFGTVMSSEFVVRYIPELKERVDFFEQCFRDLLARGLIEKSAREQQLITVAGPFAGKVTTLGHQFLKFISTPSKASGP